MNTLRFEQSHMDTRVTISVESSAAYRDMASCVREAFGVFRDMEERFSLFRYGSEISSVNRLAGQAVRVSRQFIELLDLALEMRKLSDGYFDPLHGSPSNKNQVFIDKSRQEITVTAGGRLDLNSIVKGNAIDEAISRLPNGVGAMIEAGGDMAMTRRVDGRNWTIGVRDPHSPRNIITVLPIIAGAVCTSGEYFRGAHLSKNKNGSQMSSSVTVVGATAALADMISTAAFRMPIAAALDFSERVGGECLIIDLLGREYASPLMRERLRLAATTTDNSRSVTAI